MRGQAELISTVIIVAIAVTLALGLIYYFTPLIAQLHEASAVSALLSQATSCVSIEPVSVENLTGNYTAVAVFIGNKGDCSAMNFYGLVVGFDNVTGLPSTLPPFNASLGNSSVLVLSSNAGWVPLSGFNVSVGSVYLFIRDGFYPLGDLRPIREQGIVNATLYNLGMLGGGESKLYRFIYDSGKAPLNAVVVLIKINDRFYEVGRYLVQG